jgi:hypothetical protein
MRQQTQEALFMIRSLLTWFRLNWRLVVAAVFGLSLAAAILGGLWLFIIRPVGGGAADAMGTVGKALAEAFAAADPNVRLIVVALFALAILVPVAWRMIVKPTPEPAPAPKLATGIDAFRLHIQGRGFNAASKIYVNMIALPTQYISSTNLAAYVRQDHFIHDTSGVPGIVVEVRR